MKFPTFKNDNSSICHIGGVTKGITEQKSCHKPEDLGLTACNNVIYKDGFLQNRLGLLTDDANLIDNSEYSENMYSTTEDTGIEIQTELGMAKMIVEKINYDISAYILLAHFITEDGTYFKSAPIYFQRVETNIFYVPSKVSFFKGKPISGAGIFAFVYLENQYDYSQNNSKIFEINSDLAGWTNIYSPYIPTVYINGRGNYFEKAKSTNQSFEGTPKLLESLNLLEHRFHSYFSTDGFSSSFRLPYSSLTDDKVVCRLYYTVSSYVEWVIPAGQNTVSQTLYGVSVKMTVNREKGIVSFSVPTGEYAMPLITDRNENNLRITATKDCDYDIHDIFAADSFLNHKGKFYIASKGCIFSARESNPLYFPRESVIKITDQDKKINALCPLGDKIIAFGENEIYSLDLTDGKALNTVSLLAENDSIFYGADTLKHTVISNSIGCNDNTVVCGDLNRIFWVADDGHPYCLLTTGKILCLSDVAPKSWMTDWWGKCFGIIKGNEVMFFKGNNALVLTAEHLPTSQTDTMEAYYWEFPANMLFFCGFNSGGKPRIVSTVIPSKLLFVSTLGENEDIYFDKPNSKTVLLTSPIASTFETQYFDFGCENYAKKINSISLNIDCKNAELSLNDSFKMTASKKGSDQKIKFPLGICGTSYIKLSLKTEKPMKLSEIDIKYTVLKI